VQELLIRIQNLLYNYQQRKSWLKAIEVSTITQNTKLISSQKQEKVKQVNALPTISIKEQEWLKEVETYAKATISNNNFNASQLYMQMNMAEQTFRRHLRKITGMTAVKYIKELRLQEARELLENKKYSTIQQVCYAVGISTPKYFSKQFKERFGKNPSEYLST